MAQSISDFVFDMNSEQLTYFPRTRGSPADVLDVDPTDSSSMGCQEQLVVNNSYDSSSLKDSDLCEFPGRLVGMVASCSMEKLANHVNISGHCFPHAVTVRCSKSQETYFDNSEMTCVEIDLDDNVLSSVDALNYGIFTDSDVRGMFKNSVNKTEELLKESFHYEHINGVSLLENNLLTSRPCTETVSKTDHQSLESESLNSSFRLDGLLFCSDRLMTRKLKCLSFIPQRENLFSQPTLLRSRSMEFTCHDNLSTDTTETLWYPPTKHQLDSVPLSQSGKDGKDALDDLQSDESSSLSSGTLQKSPSAPEDQGDNESRKNLRDGSDADNNLMFMQLKEMIFNCSVNEQDRPSAARLAKRLFSLDGFKTTDISRHLCKK